MLRTSAIRSESSGFERPEKSMSLPDGPRSIQRPRSPLGCGTATSGSSRPGSRVSSVVPLSTVALLDDLALPRDRKRSRREVLRDGRSCSDPSIVANLHGRNKDIVAAGMDVASDHGSLLPRPELRPVVRGDRARCDVRILTDVGVADVRQVRHFRSLPNAGVLDLDEGPYLDVGRQHGPRPQVGKRAYRRPRPDVRVDDDRMRADLRTGANDGPSPQHRERMDDGVGLDLDVRVDPGGGGIDDRDTCEQVPLDEAIAQDRRSLGELSAVVDPEAHDRIGGTVHGSDPSVLDEGAYGVRQIELTLDVVRV